MSLTDFTYLRGYSARFSICNCSVGPCNEQGHYGPFEKTTKAMRSLSKNILSPCCNNFDITPKSFGIDVVCIKNPGIKLVLTVVDVRREN